VTVNATDAVGNPATAVTIPTVAVTRVKWMRQVAAAPLVGAPVLSASVGQVIVGGNAVGGNPIQSVRTADGGLAWSAGHLLVPVLDSVAANMALDPTPASGANPTTPVLYVNGTDNAYALHINGNSIDKSCSLNIPGVRGSPVLFGAGASGEAVVVGPSIARAYMLSAAGGGCTEPHVGLEFGATALNPGLGPPSANGSTVFMGYDNSGNGTATDIGLKSIQFTGGIFGTTIATGTIGKQPTSNVGQDALTPASELFFEVNLDTKGYRYATDLTTQRWATPALGQNIFSQPLVSGQLLFLSSTALFFHNLADGTATAPPSQFPAASVTRVSPPTFGKTASFLSDAANKEVVAFDPATRTQIWSFKGSGTTAPSTALSSVATEAALGADGVLYFGDSVGHVYALITDTTPATTAPGDWPRTGFDNCNSNHAGNTGFTCQ
jgi:outer membrane protein assembly factor BamB